MAIKVGVADFGLMVWYGGFYDELSKLQDLKDIGYEGTERMHALNADDAMRRACYIKRLGMDFATCLAPNVEMSIQWTAALGRKYVWTNVMAGMYSADASKNFDAFCRQVNYQAEACKRYGIDVAVHNHLNTAVETQPQLEEFMQRCPECKLVFDTAHLAAAGGDAMYIAEKYFDRLASLHVKDWHSEGNVDGRPKGRFCELGAGNIGLDNAAVVKKIVGMGYDGWIFVEQDTHLRDPLLDLKASREYLRAAGV